MCRFDSANTLYKFFGKVNHRRFGVPMGGFISPASDILCCGMIVYGMEHVVSWLDLWFDAWMMCLVYDYAVSNDAEESR